MKTCGGVLHVMLNSIDNLICLASSKLRHIHHHTIYLFKYIIYIHIVYYTFKPTSLH